MKNNWNIAGIKVEMYSSDGKIWFVNKPEDTRRLGLYAGMKSVDEAHRLLKGVTFVQLV